MFPSQMAGRAVRCRTPRDGNDRPKSVESYTPIVRISRRAASRPGCVRAGRQDGQRVDPRTPCGDGTGAARRSNSYPPGGEGGKTAMRATARTSIASAWVSGLGRVEVSKRRARAGRIARPTWPSRSGSRRAHLSQRVAWMPGQTADGRRGLPRTGTGGLPRTRTGGYPSREGSSGRPQDPRGSSPAARLRARWAARATEVAKASERRTGGSSSRMCPG